MEMTVTEEATTEEIVAWLESPEGEWWSQRNHSDCLHHEGGFIASLKIIYDHPEDLDAPYMATRAGMVRRMEAWPEITGWTPDDPPEGGKPE